MSTRTLVVDSGGTTRRVKRMAVVDSGGTTRLLKRAFVIDSGGTARKIFQSGVDFTLTADSDDDPGPATYRGYIQGTTGSISDSSDGNGHTIIEITVNLSTSRTRLQISGFGSDPGQSFVDSLINNTSGITKTVASDLFSYLYGSGFATWTFTGAIFTTTGAFSMTLVAG